MVQPILKTMKLTPEEIQEICSELHERMQFFDSNGENANNTILSEVAEQLTEAFIDEPELEGIRAEQQQEITDGLHG